MAENDKLLSSASYARLQEAYGGKYVATRGEEVLASAARFGELLGALKARDDYTEDVVLNTSGRRAGSVRIEFP